MSCRLGRSAQSACATLADAHRGVATMYARSLIVDNEPAPVQPAAAHVLGEASASVERPEPEGLDELRRPVPEVGETGAPPSAVMVLVALYACLMSVFWVAFGHYE